jgi:hypothetical protein
MRAIGKAAIATLFAAGSLCSAQALAATAAPAAPDKMSAAPAPMQPMHPMHITCKSTMSKDSMTVEFHNMGKSEIPAGTKVHWMMNGMAQGDMDFTDAVAPGKMASQDYMMKGSGQTPADTMHASAPCMVEPMH